MTEISQKVEQLKYKTIAILKLTRGIARDSSELIGNTPLVRLNRITKGTKAEVVAQFESFNLLGSVKDRIQDMMRKRVMAMLWLMCCPKGLDRTGKI